MDTGAPNPDSSPEDAWDSLKAEISDFTEELFKDHQIRGKKALSGSKVIRDSVHGYHSLTPWEVEIIDSPLIQRLRYIHQTALTYQLYPSAHHTRFEHSLGTLKLISDVSLSMRSGEYADLFSDDIEGELRLGALLHDIGHCLFSHLSEQIIDELFKEKLDLVKDLDFFEGKATGEILSHALIISPAVQEFLNGIFAEYGKPYNAERVAGYCIGKPDPPDLDSYRADLITGPLDVDKLDYLQRDTYFTGIRTDIDVQHIVRSMTIAEVGGSRTIAARVSAVSGVEQMHFAKTLLFPAVYYHQKVRALEATVRGVFEAIQTQPDLVPEHMRFHSIGDFLRTSEHEFFSLARLDNEIGIRVKRILDRKVLRRSLHISNNAIVGREFHSDGVGGSHPGYGRFLTLAGKAANMTEERSRIRQAIYDEIPTEHKQPGSKHSLWLDIPGRPVISKDVQRCVVVGLDKSHRKLTEIFPIDRWLDTYSDNRWTQHVFYEPEEDAQEAASRAAARVLQSEFDLEFNDLAYTEAKVHPPRP